VHDRICTNGNTWSVSQGLVGLWKWTRRHQPASPSIFTAGDAQLPSAFLGKGQDREYVVAFVLLAGCFVLLLCCSCESSGVLEKRLCFQGLDLCCSCCSKIYTFCQKQSNTSNTNLFTGRALIFLEETRATQSNTEQHNSHRGLPQCTGGHSQAYQGTFQFYV
jgi:hypothetical protein